MDIYLLTGMRRKYSITFLTPILNENIYKI